MYVCAFCGDTFHDIDEAERHVITEHPDKLPATNDIQRLTIKYLSQALKASETCFECLKKLTINIAGNNSVFINACIAVTKWEEMDLYLENILEYLRENLPDLSKYVVKR